MDLSKFPSTLNNSSDVGALVISSAVLNLESTVSISLLRISTLPSSERIYILRGLSVPGSAALFNPVTCLSKSGSIYNAAPILSLSPSSLSLSVTNVSNEDLSIPVISTLHIWNRPLSVILSSRYSERSLFDAS